MVEVKPRSIQSIFRLFRYHFSYLILDAMPAKYFENFCSALLATNPDTVAAPLLQDQIPACLARESATMQDALHVPMRRTM